MKKHILVFVFLAALSLVVAQSTGDYRSKISGNWNATSSWETYNGSAWVNATATPTASNAGVITIRNGHTITVTAKVSVDQTVIEAGGKVIASAGTLTIANGTGTDMTVYGTLEKVSDIAGTGSTVVGSGGTYIHNRNSDALLVATWEDGSTCEIIGVTNAQPSQRDQDFYNLTWNCPNQTTNENSTGGDFKTFRGTLKVVSTGTGTWTWTDTNTNTKNINNYEQSGGTVSMTMNGGSITAYITGDFTMSGGTLTENGGATGCKWVFQKAGTQLFNKSVGTISQTISYEINSGTTVDVVNQPFTGLGTFTLASGAGLIIRDAAGITSSGASGAVQVTGTRTYSTGADYTYAGTSAQVTGSGLPSTVNGLYIKDPAGVTLSNSVTVTNLGFSDGGDLALNSNSLTLAGKDIAFTSSNAVFSDLSVSTSTEYINEANRPVWTTYADFTNTVSTTFRYPTTYSSDASIDLWYNDNNTGWVKYGNFIPTQSGSYMYVTVSGMTNLGSSSANRKWTFSPTDEPLPVVLSSFTVTVSGSNSVDLTWITQSETGMVGYYILRSTANNVSGAQIISPMIDASNTAQQQIYIYTDDTLTANGYYYYWLESLDLDGNFDFHGPIAVYFNANGEYGNPEIPIYTALKQIYPNPFNPQAFIPYSVAAASEVAVRIYNSRGQLVRSFEPGTQVPGEYRIEWDGKDANGANLANGIYYVRMTAGRDTFQRKAVLLK